MLHFHAHVRVSSYCSYSVSIFILRLRFSSPLFVFSTKQHVWKQMVPGIRTDKSAGVLNGRFSNGLARGGNKRGCVALLGRSICD